MGIFAAIFWTLPHYHWIIKLYYSNSIMYYSWRSVCDFLVSQLSDLEHDLREAKTKEHDTQHERNYVQVQLSRLEADRTDLQQRLATVTQERNSLENTVAELQDLNRYDTWVWAVIWPGSGPCVLFCGSPPQRLPERERGRAGSDGKK